jgi:hypothetical protein
VLELQVDPAHEPDRDLLILHVVDLSHHVHDCRTPAGPV